VIADAQRWTRIEQIFDAVLDCSAAEIETLLERSCAGDRKLRREVERLLAADERAGDFLSTPPQQWIGNLEVTGNDVRPARIGPFRVLDELGRGGMGVVYLAERVDGQFEQRVAVKCIGGWTGGPAVQARFLRERKILARLEHPNIARLLDGGMTTDGRPYFAMEWVDGEPITTYCERLGLDLDRRVELFLDVCRGVEGAHRRLIVHRDLKPSNILVTRTAQVKLLDFGLAKLFDLDEDDGLATATHHRLLTPVYASPEQLDGRDATTLTDVYGLGLVLYELLSGGRPFEMEGRSFSEYRRDVLEREPRRPCAPGTRGADDLDAICLKALRKEPDERYRSVEALRQDLEHFSAGLPVEARQGSTGYRLRKFLGRRRVESLAAVVVLVALLSGAGIALYHAHAASVERRRAEMINEFFVEEMIGAATPEESRGRKISVEEVLDAAARRVETAFAGEPGMEAAVRWTLGRSYASLGRDDRAETQLAGAAGLFSGTAGPQAAETLGVQADLAALRGRAGDFARAEEELTEIHRLEVELLGPRHLDSLRTERMLAEVQAAGGNYLDGQRRFEKVIETLEREYPEAQREILAAMSGLCRALQLQRANDQAERVCRRTLELQRTELGPDHPDTLRSEAGVARVLKQLDRFDESAELLERSVPSHERVLGQDHESTLSVLNWLAGTYWGMDRVGDAHDTWAEALQRAERSLGPNHQRTIDLTRNTAMAARGIGDWERAESMYELALERSRVTLGPHHPRTLKLAKQFAVLLIAVDKRKQGVALLREAIQLSEQVARRPDAEPTVLNDYAWFLLTGPVDELQDERRALELAIRSVALTERRHPGFLDTLAHAHHRTGDLERAIEIEREALELPDSLHRYDMERTMVNLLTEAGRPAEVEEFLLRHLERRREERPEGDPTIGETLRWLGRHATSERRYAEAEDWLEQARDHFRSGSGKDNWRECRVLGDLGQLRLQQQRPDEAESILREALRCAEKRAGRRDDVLAQARQRLADLPR